MALYEPKGTFHLPDGLHQCSCGLQFDSDTAFFVHFDKENGIDTPDADPADPRGQLELFSLETINQ